MTGLTYAWLSERPQWVPRLAALHHAQWAPLLKDWTREAAATELATHTGGARVPTTLVAEVDGALAGSVSLLASDDLDARDWSPWLASLLVLPPFRRRGLGAELVRRCVAVARELGIGTLYLYTDDAAGWYERLGWSRVARTSLHGVEVDVMSIACAEVHSRLPPLPHAVASP
jgi:N-acetylglutamate synthase-like GNAT family acetyltransferase